MTQHSAAKRLRQLHNVLRVGDGERLPDDAVKDRRDRCAQANPEAEYEDHGEDDCGRAPQRSKRVDDVAHPVLEPRQPALRTVVVGRRCERPERGCRRPLGLGWIHPGLAVLRGKHVPVCAQLLVDLVVLSSTAEGAE